MAAKRELIEPTKGDKRYVRRSAGGQFKEVDDLNRSLSADRRRKARTTAAAGQGDRGDRPTAGARKTGVAKKKPAGAKKKPAGAKKASAAKKR